MLVVDCSDDKLSSRCECISFFHRLCIDDIELRTLQIVIQTLQEGSSTCIITHLYEQDGACIISHLAVGLLGDDLLHSILIIGHTISVHHDEHLLAGRCTQLECCSQSFSSRSTTTRRHILEQRQSLLFSDIVPCLAGTTQLNHTDTITVDLGEITDQGTDGFLHRSPARDRGTSLHRLSHRARDVGEDDEVELAQDCFVCVHFSISYYIFPVIRTGTVLAHRTKFFTNLHLGDQAVTLGNQPRNDYKSLIQNYRREPRLALSVYRGLPWGLF